MFYTRFLDARLQNRLKHAPSGSYPYFAYPAFLSVIELPYLDHPNRVLYFGPNICVATATVSSINVSTTNYYSNQNPWKKYYRSPVDLGGGGWTWNVAWTNAAGGFDTAILPTPGTYGKVSWNSYLNSYIMITHKQISPTEGAFYLHQSNVSDLLSWQPGAELSGISELNKRNGYPSLIGSSGSGVNDKATNKYNILYYARDDNNSQSPFVNGDHYMVRRTLTFD